VCLPIRRGTRLRRAVPLRMGLRVPNKISFLSFWGAYSCHSEELCDEESKILADALFLLSSTGPTAKDVVDRAMLKGEQVLRPEL
jgi:hypothetical protein